MATHSPRQTGRHSHKKIICEICGGIDFQEAIITCYQCKNVDVHQHCVQGYCVDAPKNWCCQKCNIGKEVISSSRGLENENSEGSRLHASAKICQSTLPPKKRMKIRELSSPDVVKASRMMNPLMTHPCDPALVHSWKGSFEILGALEFVPAMLNNCIKAYPPSKVRRKVYEFSCLLPDTLKVELVPRGDIWASILNNRIPTKEDIGLYFFASEKERSERYIALVELMRSKDLVMRTHVNDVELLILASTSLCSDSQRWNSEHFLWGLFYPTGQDTDGCAEGGSNKVIDMEVDMIAGENVGTLDVVVLATTFKNGGL